MNYSDIQKLRAIEIIWVDWKIDYELFHCKDDYSKFKIKN